MIELVGGERIGGDNNKYLIALFKAIQSDWDPPVELSKTEYVNILKAPDSFPYELSGFALLLCSYRGTYGAGYGGEMMARRARNSLLKQKGKLSGVHFQCCDYTDLSFPEGSLIYCDPPYKGMKRRYLTKFDTKSFWEWSQSMAMKGNIVFVSEMEAPEFCSLMWSGDVFSSLKVTRSEKLYSL